MEEQSSIRDGAGPRALAKPVPRRDESVADRVRRTEFPAALRGYDREAVDDFMAQVADLIDTLEARQARESVVQRALEEVGEETSAILKQAHEAADDITARSRSQAEDRVEVARREAAAITREAKLEAAELQRETQDLRLERANLIEELRRFASETLALADAAADRFEPAPLEEVAEETHPVEESPPAPLAEPAEPPYDGTGDLPPSEEDWQAQEDPDPDPPTEELRIPSEEDPADEPPRSGGA